jgi:uracil-DNA glycosylase family 4
MPLAQQTKGVMPEAPPDCPICPRLVAFRAANRAAHPDWFNGAVPSFGPETARLLIVGLAPGLKGANRTGRPFLGDHAGELLYRTLLKVGLAKGHHDPAAPEALKLVDCMITNAVRCVPPANKPTPSEIAHCRAFLEARIAALPRLETILALGRIAHEGTLDALGLKRRAYPFAHGARHRLVTGQVLFDSYHCSRQNTNTGRLTATMFETVLADIAGELQLTKRR